ncbi:DUF116 domain-containing protein [Methanococcoides seepicolus]|uniref:DUF116 domain-containing protein n=1 Tax=Methanococcoides seepicolus TaxID=2828780 RepID=A0A9E4ZDN4_9EURY|nr:DUF116 domain-containing protein [Methanococcoides seepicolus]MCM1985850.1 DUF116 domain-containing protein [Methanococcoides seepicolus]
MEIPYELLGKLFVYMLLFALLGIVVALLVGFYSFKNKKVIFPNFVLFMLYLFYSPAKWMCGVFSIRDTLVDEILIEIRNAVMLDEFVRATGTRAIFLPQCMRHANCRARCDPILGYECKKCGLCDIGSICEAADERGFRVYVIPGGSFVKKIMKAHKPGSCIGVACYNELSESMEEISFMPVQGVCLLKDGCFNTKVDVLEVIEKMELCNV